MNSTMDMDISTPTPTKKEGIGAMFSSPTGVIDAEQKTFRPENFLAPNLDIYQSSPITSQQQQPTTPPNDEFISIPELLDGLPPLLGTLPNDDEEDDDDDDEPMARVAETFEDKEQLREGGGDRHNRVVKFCPWKQARECSREFRYKAYELEKEEAVSFRRRHEEEVKLEHQQEEDFNQRRIHMFTERAHQILQDEAKDFKNIANIRRQVHDLKEEDSPRSMLLRKRLFHEAMSD